MCVLCLAYFSSELALANPTPDNDMQTEKQKKRGGAWSFNTTDVSYLKVCIMFDTGVRVRLLPKPSSETRHEVGDALNDDRPLAPWYVVEQLLIQNCHLLRLQEVGEKAQPGHINTEKNTLLQ